jgi:hypothetical protein
MYKCAFSYQYLTIKHERVLYLQYVGSNPKVFHYAFVRRFTLNYEGQNTRMNYSDHEQAGLTHFVRILTIH